MKIVIAIDSFKECLSSAGVASRLASGIKKVYPEANIKEIPIADGGEGTLDAMCLALGAEKIQVQVHDPLMRQITAEFGWHEPESLAIIEMATASGLERLNKSERNPCITSSFGTGELVKAALDKGCKKMILGIGGSATNDAGSGMAKALGVRFLDVEGKDLPEGGKALSELHRIDVSQLDERIKTMKTAVACDVSNTICGSDGASAVFGPQKGATPDMVQHLDLALSNFCKVVKSDLGKDIESISGGGAAGGLGAGLNLFLNAELVPGFELISSTVKLEQEIADADFVVTGEGRLDGQTLNGKTPLVWLDWQKNTTNH